MEASLWQTTQEEAEESEPKACTPKKFVDKTMHRLRGMKRLIERRARVPRWILQDMESIESLVKMGHSCNFFPEEGRKKLVSFKIMLSKSDQPEVREWAKEVEYWIKEWQMIHDEWG
jgi:hypothetical protein